MKAIVVYGSAGTGKTTLLLELLDGLKQRGYASNEIAYFSFTKAAIANVLGRLGLKSSPFVSTLHSMCFNHLELKKHSVIDIGLLKKFGVDCGYRFTGADWADMSDGDMCMAMYSLLRSRMCSLDGVSSSAVLVPRHKLVEFSSRYESWKSDRYLIDFNDMLSMYADNPPRSCARALFIDEAQDLSPLQWRVVRSFIKAADIDLVVVAGDDDQAIYEWSGANPHGMQEFEADFSAERIVLDEGHRMSENIHNLAHSVIAKVKRRVDKTVSPPRAGGDIQGVSVLYKSVIGSWDDCLVLARTNKIKKEVESRLVEQGIAFSNRENTSPWENSLAVAYRALRDYRRGAALTPKQMTVIKRCVEPDVVACIEAAEPIGDRYWDALRVSPRQYDFYRNFDPDEVPRVVVSTIHASKGSEANNVVLCDSISGVVADAQYLNPDAEARVWFVGVSRARDRLFILRDLTLGDRYGL